MKKLTSKKVLITGGAGFIGANFVYKFLEMGYKVFVAERKEADLWRIKKVKNKIGLYSPDFLNYKATEKFILKIKPDIVIHFATYGAYQKFQQDIDMTIDTNLKGTINLVNACYRAKVKCFINTSSSSEYGIKDAPMKEGDMLEADNLYGITKSAATLYCQMMARKFGFLVVTTRLFSVYGPFEEKERLIPDIITACLKNTALKLSKPDSVRDFIFIEDLISAYMLIIKNIKKIRGEVFNIGTGKQSTVQDVAVMVKRITGSNIMPEYNKVRLAQTEPKSWVADIFKIKKRLYWKPDHSLKEGLKKNIEWFKNNLDVYA